MDSNITVNQLLDNIDTSRFKQVDYATLFIWLLTDVKGKTDCLMSDIIQCFKDASLGIPNQTLLRRNLRARTKEITVGHSYKSFRLHRNALIRFHSEYANILACPASPEEIIRERIDVNSTPQLTTTDIENAIKMGQVYVVIHCLENSVRNLIRKVLRNALGEQWWDKAASDSMKRDVERMRANEARNRWLSSRGIDELDYTFWGDLVTFMRKYPLEFEASIGNIKFAELKLEELEKLRNTIAHNGVLPNEEIARIELYFKDWCKQVPSL